VTEVGRWITLAATLGVIAFNSLANALPLGGKTTGEISDGFDILFTPAGYVFSIWGLIYLGLMVFAVAQLRPSAQQDPVLAALRPAYWVSCLANMSWLVAWHYEQFAVSWLLMITLLGSLIAVYRRVRTVGADERGRYVWLRAPFALYLGWITVATFANTTVVGWRAGLTGLLSDPLATLVLIAVATTVGAWVTWRDRDPVYGGVFVWALIGIAAANAGETLLTTASWLLAGICGLVGLAAIVANQRARRSVTAPAPV